VNSNDDAREEYTAGGYRFIRCKKCGAKFNAGRPGNGAGIRWCNGLKEEWWAKHTGAVQDQYAITLCKEDVPEMCPSLIS
jgi:hypothetical protein